MPHIQLIEHILAIPDEKIVTVTSGYLGSNSYDISGAEIGHDPSHASLFAEHVEEAVAMHGAVIVRVFDPVCRVKIFTPRGWRAVPIKHLYGVACGNGRWEGLSKEEVAASFSRDAKTGAPLAPRNDEVYRGWPAVGQASEQG